VAGLASVGSDQDKSGPLNARAVLWASRR